MNNLFRINQHNVQYHLDNYNKSIKNNKSKIDDKKNFVNKSNQINQLNQINMTNINEINKINIEPKQINYNYKYENIIL